MIPFRASRSPETHWCRSANGTTPTHSKMPCRNWQQCLGKPRVLRSISHGQVTDKWHHRLDGWNPNKIMLSPPFSTGDNRISPSTVCSSIENPKHRICGLVSLSLEGKLTQHGAKMSETRSKEWVKQRFGKNLCPQQSRNIFSLVEVVVVGVQDRLHTCKKWTKGQFLAGDSSQMWMGGKTKRGFDGPKPKCDWEISQSQKKNTCVVQIYYSIWRKEPLILLSSCQPKLTELTSHVRSAWCAHVGRDEAWLGGIQEALHLRGLVWQG